MIEEGSVVLMDYTLTVDGEVADTSEGKEPLEYVHGKGMIIPGLEKELAGLQAGDEKKVTVAAQEGYGEINQDAIVQVPRQNLAGGQEPQAGMVIQLQGKDGRKVSGVIKDVAEETLTVDFNHPLAGKQLTFDIKIVEVK